MNAINNRLSVSNQLGVDQILWLNSSTKSRLYFTSNNKEQIKDHRGKPMLYEKSHSTFRQRESIIMFMFYLTRFSTK